MAPDPVSDPQARSSDPAPELPVQYRTFTQWPNLLLGPMLRKVTRNKAWVFIATKKFFDARILIGEGALDYTSVPSVTDDYGVPLRKLGHHLYVGLLEVDLPNPGPDTLYSYDIQLAEPEAGGSSQRPLFRLNDMGLLGNPLPDTNQQKDPLQEGVPLGYLTNRLPSFKTPPATPEALRMAQASCRKPHGNTDDAYEPDAIPIIDEIIARSIPGARSDEPADSSRTWYDAKGNPHSSAPAYPPADLQERPHQLIMTGDQIYADDVSPALLDAIMDASDKLMGYEEFLPGIIDGLNGFLVRPGWRSRYLTMSGVKDPAPPEGPDYDQSHLLRFGEWCAMYIMAWSTTLWPRSEDNKNARLKAAEDQVKVSELIGFLSITKKLTTIKGKKKNKQPRFTFLWNYLASKAEDQLKATEDEFDKKKKLWTKYRDPAMQYGSTVPFVRRVLANTPTYTMFDDHEITDDWYITRRVAERLLGYKPSDDEILPGDPPLSAFWGRHVGPRILRNGLSAYAIFQHWGNVPDDFEGWHDTPVPAAPSVGVQLLEHWMPRPNANNTPGPPTIAPEPTGTIPEYLIGGTIWWLSTIHVDATPEELVAEIPEAAHLDWQAWNWAPQDAERDADVLLRIDDYPTDDNGEYPGTGTPSNRSTFNRFRWDYSIEFDSHVLMALDTRTWRRFPSGTAPPPPPAVTGPAETFAARDLTASILSDLAQPWISSVDPGSNLLGLTLQATAAVLTETNPALLETRLTELADATQAFLSTALTGTLNLDTATTVVDFLRDDMTGASEFPTRIPVTEEISAWVRAEELFREIAEQQSMAIHERTDGALATEIIFTALYRYLETLTLGTVQGTLTAMRTFANELAGAPAFLSSVLEPLDFEQGEINDARDAAVLFLNAEITALQVHERSNIFFRDGSAYLAAELISAPAMEWMVTAPIAAVPPGKETVILSPAPMFADHLVDAVQRILVANATLSNLPGAETWEFESWGANPVGFDNLVVAAKGLKRAAVLSGDVHYAYSSTNTVILEKEDVETVYVQLTSSSAKNSDSTTKRIGLFGYLSLNKSPSSTVFQFNPEVLFNHGWDYFNPANLAPGSPGTSYTIERFVGWVEEELIRAGEDAIQHYHIDDFLNMMKEFRTINTMEEFLKWTVKWFFEPALKGVLSGIQNPGAYAAAAWDYITTAPPNAFFSWIQETLWMMIAMFHNFVEWADDPKEKLFGHSLYGRDVMLKLVGDLYKALGVDPAYGYQINKISLNDVQGDDRLLHYGARDRFISKSRKTRYTMSYGNEQESFVVGNSNIGLIRFVDLSNNPARRELAVRHDLCFYPDPSHPDVDNNHPQNNPDVGRVDGLAYGRKDWMATRHIGTFKPDLRNQDEEAEE